MKPAEYLSLLAAVIVAPQLNEVFAWIVFGVLGMLSGLVSWLERGK